MACLIIRQRSVASLSITCLCQCIVTGLGPAAVIDEQQLAIFLRSFGYCALRPTSSKYAASSWRDWVDVLQNDDVDVDDYRLINGPWNRFEDTRKEDGGPGREGRGTLMNSKTTICSKEIRIIRQNVAVQTTPRRIRYSSFHSNCFRCFGRNGKRKKKEGIIFSYFLFSLQNGLPFAMWIHV